MPGRILTLQRQARELGRLRSGVTETKMINGRERTFPTRSKTWILTSHQREYLEAAAEEWGGQVEAWQPQGNGAKSWRVVTDAPAIDAIMPPGDPLSQHYEMWSKGGCQRRCDGETEQLSGKACPCRAQFGEEFHLQDPKVACRPHTRLNVILPGLPDLGVWRAESKGFYAANEIAAAVDLIRHATGGTVAVPIRLRIEPRQRIAQGKTKHYPVIVVEIRGATAGQILAGRPQTIELEGAPQRQAIEAAAPASANDAKPPRLTPEQVIKQAAMARNVPQVKQLGADAEAAGAATPEVKDVLNARWRELKALDEKPPASNPAADPVSAPPAVPPPAEPAAEVVDADTDEPDADTVWSQINAYVGKNQKWKSDELEKRFIETVGTSSIDANGWQLVRFLDALKAGDVK